MDRKRFLQGLALGGIALGTGVVWKAVARQRLAAPIPLPGIRYHVRHGLLDLPGASQATPLLPSWMPPLERNHFFANGVDQREDDLIYTSLKLAESPWGLTLRENSFTTTHEIHQIDLKPGKRVHCLTRDRIAIHLLQVDGKTELQAAGLGKEQVLLSLRGKANLRDISICDGKGALINGKANASIHLNGNATMMVISQT